MEPFSDPSTEKQRTLLLADYNRWLAFVMNCRLTTRRYDQQLRRIKRHFPQLETLSNYLRDCMRQRSSFFGQLATVISRNEETLRSDPANSALIRRLTYVHPGMQALIQQLTADFAEIEESYRTLPALPTSGSQRIANG